MNDPDFEYEQCADDKLQDQILEQIEQEGDDDER